MMPQLFAWPVVFGGFWYRFIIGDDWTVAAAVAVGLVLPPFSRLAMSSPGGSFH